MYKLASDFFEINMYLNLEIYVVVANFQPLNMYYLLFQKQI